MRELIIRNIRIESDALKSGSPENEAQQLVAAINNAINQWDSSPALLFDGAVVAEYRKRDD